MEAIIAIVLVIIAIIIWAIYGKDEKAKIITIEDALKDSNLIEIAFTYDSTLSQKDVVAMIIDLINRGAIIATKKGKDFILSRNNKCKSVNVLENNFLWDIFDRNKEITLSKSENLLYNAIEKVRTNINHENNMENFFVKKSLNKYSYLLVILLAIIVLGILRPVSELYELDYFFATFFSLSIILVTYFLIHIIIDIGKRHFVATLFSFVVLGSATYLVVNLVINKKVYIINFIVCVLCALITYILLKNITKRNSKGDKVYSKGVSIKKFLLNDFEKYNSVDLELKIKLMPYMYIFNLEHIIEANFDDDYSISIEVANMISEMLNSRDIQLNDADTIMKNSKKLSGASHFLNRN